MFFTLVFLVYTFPVAKKRDDSSTCSFSSFSKTHKYSIGKAPPVHCARCPLRNRSSGCDCVYANAQHGLSFASNRHQSVSRRHIMEIYIFHKNIMRTIQAPKRAMLSLSQSHVFNYADASIPASAGLTVSPSGAAFVTALTYAPTF